MGRARRGGERWSRSSGTAPALPRYLRLQRRFALLQHHHYLTTLLATYRGPLHAAWEAELARVNALLAELGG